jgi:hypothetical protein
LAGRSVSFTLAINKDCVSWPAVLVDISNIIQPRIHCQRLKDNFPRTFLDNSPILALFSTNGIILVKLRWTLAREGTSSARRDAGCSLG